MTVTFSSQSNTNLTLSVQPSDINNPATVTYTWPSQLPASDALVQCDSNGFLRFVDTTGLALGESRNYMGSFTGVCTGGGTAVQLARVTGGTTSIRIPPPSELPSGYYLEALIRGYTNASTSVSSFRLISAALCNIANGWQLSSQPSTFGAQQDNLQDVLFTLTPQNDGSAELGLQAVGDNGLRVEADATVFAPPSATA